MADQVLRLIITGNVSGADRAMRDLQRSLDQTATRFTNYGRSMTLYVTLPILAAGAAAGKLAMDAVESENLFNVSLGSMAVQARKWSNDISRSLGLNSYEVRRYVGTFDVMLQSFGLGEAESLKMSEGITQLAYDMASFYNLKPEVAFEKIRSGIAGQVRPLRELGISLDLASVKTYAYTHGIAAQGAELTTAEKVQARYGLLLEQTSKAQGDLARTLESPENKLRRLEERAKNVGIAFGVVMLPAISAVLDKGLALANWLYEMDDGTKALVISTLALTAGIGPALIVVGQMAAGLAALHKVYMALNAAVRVNAAATAAASVENAKFAGFLGKGGMLGAIIATGAAFQTWNQRTIAQATGLKGLYQREAEWVAQQGVVGQALASVSAKMYGFTLSTQENSVVKQANKAATLQQIIAESQAASAAMMESSAMDQLTRSLDGSMVAAQSAAGMQRTLADRQRDAARSALDVKDAQQRYNDAVREYGPASDQAKRAQLDLQDAEQRAKDTTADYKTALEDWEDAAAEARAEAKQLADQNDRIRDSANKAAAALDKMFGKGAGDATAAAGGYGGRSDRAFGAIETARPGGVWRRVAEAGDDEAIIPLNSRPRSFGLLAEAARRMGASMGQTVVNQYFPVASAADGPAVKQYAQHGLSLALSQPTMNPA